MQGSVTGTEILRLILDYFKTEVWGSEILILVDVEFYRLSNDISFVKISILHFAVDRHKVRHVMFINTCILVSMKKKRMGEVWKTYMICRLICELKKSSFLENCILCFLLFILAHLKF